MLISEELNNYLTGVHSTTEYLRQQKYKILYNKIKKLKRGKYRNENGGDNSSVNEKRSKTFYEPFKNFSDIQFTEKREDLICKGLKFNTLIESKQNDMKNLILSVPVIQSLNLDDDQNNKYRDS